MELNIEPTILPHSLNHPQESDNDIDFFSPFLGFALNSAVTAVVKSRQKRCKFPVLFI